MQIVGGCIVQHANVEKALVFYGRHIKMKFEVQRAGHDSNVVPPCTGAHHVTLARGDACNGDPFTLDGWILEIQTPGEFAELCKMHGPIVVDIGDCGIPCVHLEPKDDGLHEKFDLDTFIWGGNN